MKTLNELGILDLHDFVWESPVCSCAMSIDYPDETDISKYANELVLSYFNQWQLVMDAYFQLQKMHAELNQLDDTTEKVAGFSQYDFVSVWMEDKFRDYCYLLITSMKTLLDLLACITDTIVYREIRDEHKMTDFISIRRRLKIEDHTELIALFEAYAEYPWILTVKTTRDRLIHRGYSCKPNFSFKKSDVLDICLWQGHQRSEEVISIGDIFEQFITDLQMIEQELNDYFVKKLPFLTTGPAVTHTYRNSGGFVLHKAKDAKKK